ncbi:MAG: response regulator transcription factor [Pontiellaceae bacterium]|nr:response regulator transcription factor [Pontiellaceae bacterium]MBN2786248.1 response regulator transcription factor [Pontiellaceae bacterium]
MNILIIDLNMAPGPLKTDMKNLITVAIVDDLRSTRERVADMLREEPMFKCVGSFPDAVTALRRLPKLRPDIVLMDINMPGMKGIECIRRLKPKMADTSFVILTSCKASDSVFDALSAGAVGYLLKRAIADELVPALREVARGGSRMTGEIARKVVQRFHAKTEDPDTGMGLLEELSGRQKEVFSLLARGRLCKEISDELGISIHTVNAYNRRIYEKLRVHSRAEAVAKYNRMI